MERVGFRKSFKFLKSNSSLNLLERTKGTKRKKERKSREKEMLSMLPTISWSFFINFFLYYFLKECEDLSSDQLSSGHRVGLFQKGGGWVRGHF